MFLLIIKSQYIEEGGGHTVFYGGGGNEQYRINGKTLYKGGVDIMYGGGGQTLRVLCLRFFNMCKFFCVYSMILLKDTNNFFSLTRYTM